MQSLENIRINYFPTILLVFSLLTCARIKHFTPSYSSILVEHEGRNVLEQCSRTAPTDVESFYTLTLNEISILENNFRRLLKTKSLDCCVPGLKVKNLKRTVFQYTGLVKNTFISMLFKSIRPKTLIIITRIGNPNQ